MSGTIAGGRKARDANYKRFGKDFYRNIGRKGGLVITDKPKGFAANIELAREAGRKGGKISRRGAAKDDIDRLEEELEKESGRD